MKFNVLKNLLDMQIIEDVDIIIRYNNYYANTCLDICIGLDDCVSVLIDSRFISENEVKDDIINYYEINFKDNLQLINNLISIRLKEFPPETNTV
ncbi:MAG: hypothetical protein IJA72_04550 [Clostridia bacterium]|nr:hypothetical protein [Clostridia bacterium]